MCEDLSDVFFTVRPGKTDWIVYDRRKPIPQKTSSEEWCDFIKKFISPNKNNSTNQLPNLPRVCIIVKNIFVLVDVCICCSIVVLIFQLKIFMHTSEHP